MLTLLRRITPTPVRSAYHFALAFLAAALYSFPSKRLIVIGVTGTKGKSSTLEFLNAIFEEAGHTTALASTIRTKVAYRSAPNLMRMTMAGRFFTQRFLDRALRAGCTVALIEMTSEGARQFRHRFIDLDALVFTNLAPEHIESHGSLEAYADAKFEIGKELARSTKRPRIMAAHVEDAQASRYLTLPVEESLPFSLAGAAPWTTDENGGTFTFAETTMHINLPGEFSLLNALAAAAVARALGATPEAIARALARVTTIPGRAERIDEGQDFLVIVDYAHTPDSLKSIYAAFPKRRRICVLGATGGGRDLWKRSVMGRIADEWCDEIILTNEDPYDEDPRGIVEAVARGITTHTPEIIMDRRGAIAQGIARARANDAVIITGKGTDPSICGPRGTQMPWSDAAVARAALKTRVRPNETPVS